MDIDFFYSMGSLGKNLDEKVAPLDVLLFNMENRFVLQQRV